MALRALIAIILVCAAGQAVAHRPGESYVYIDVSDAEITGAFHIRLEDLAKAIDLDADGNGSLIDAEVEARREEVANYLRDRLIFHAGGFAHRIVPEELRFFGDPHIRQMELEFDLPTLRPVPESLEVENRFLYEGVDPAHRPMLLQQSNARMRLHENEWFVSLVFEPGAERQSLSLIPPPAGPLFARFLLHGAYMMLTDPDRLLLLGALLLPLVRRREDGWQPTGGLTAAARSVCATALALSAGMAAALYVRMHFGVGPTPPFDTGLLALSLALVAVDNFHPIPGLRRWHITLLCGLLQGSGRNDYVGLVGLNKGMPEVVLTGFALGVALAVVIVAAVLVPVLVLLRDMRLYRIAALRLGSVLIIGLSAAWFTSKVLV
jgi:hypothetical protein